MGTKLQKKLAETIANENKPIRELKNVGMLLREVGYATSTSLAKPGDIIRSKGVKEELKVLGFTEVEADSVVTEIMFDGRKNAGDRLRAAELVYKRLGSLAPEKHDVRNLVVEISKEIADKHDINPGTSNNS